MADITPCPYCDCRFSDTKAVFEHLVADHFDGMAPQRARPIGSALDVGVMVGKQGARRTLALDLLLRLQPEPGDDPDEMACSRVVLLFRPDEARELGTMLISAADTANAVDS